MTQIRPALLALVAACLSACAVEMRVIHSGIVNDTVDNAECPAGLAKTAEGYVTVFIDKGDGAAGGINFFALTRDLGKTWEKPFWTIKTDRHDPHIGGGVAFSQLKDGRILGTSTDTWHSDTSLQGVFGFRKSKVRIVTWLRKASVPSLPTMLWAMMSKGSSWASSGRRFNPVTFLMLYFLRMRSRRGPLARTRSRRASILAMNSG